MEGGASAEETIKRLIESDEQQDLRQVDVVDREGRAAAFTGKKMPCLGWTYC